jgi:hypothetical protein
MIDILLSVYNGSEHLREQVESLWEQTRPDWRLWIRDDGSTDRSLELIRELQAEDARVRLLEAGENLGASRSYGRLMERPEVSADHVMLCDADDFWLPDKIERSMEAMLDAESSSPAGTPILVHTDLVVADAALRPVAASFWRHRDLPVEAVTLERILSRNVATGPTILINRSLLELAGRVPPEARYQDWWITLVAAAFGRIVALPAATVLYRQHGGNSVGAGAAAGPAGVARRMATGGPRALVIREEVRQAAVQAGAFLERYRSMLDSRQTSLLERFASIAHAGPVRRRLKVYQLAGVPEHGLLRNLSRALRA